MVAPTPVSALLHAVAVVKAGVFTVLKVLVYIFGLDYLRAMAGSEWLIAVAAATIVIASLIALRPGRSETPARLFDREPACLCGAGGRARDQRRRRGRRHAHGDARLRQDHAVLLCGRDLHRRPQAAGERARRHRLPHARDHGRLHCRRARADRAAALRRALEQVVPGGGRRRRAPYCGDRSAARQLAASTRSTSCRSWCAPSSPRPAQAPAWRPAAPRRLGRSSRRPWWRRSARLRSSSTRRRFSCSFSLSQKRRKSLT